MRNSRNLKFITIIVSILAISIVSCSRRSANSGTDLNSGASTLFPPNLNNFNFNDPNTVQNPITPPVMPLSCTIYPDANEFDLVGSTNNGNLEQAQRVNLNILATTGNMQVISVSSSLNGSQQATLPSPVGSSAIIPFDLLAAGNHTITAYVISEDSSELISCTTNILVEVTEPPNPTISILANGSDSAISIPHMAQAYLSWTTSQVDNCQLMVLNSNIPPYPVPNNGSLVTNPLTGTLQITLQCTSESGNTVNDSIMVNVAAEPSLSLTGNGNADELLLDSGQNLALSWTSTGMTYCVLYGTNLETRLVDPAGNFTVNGINSDQSYGFSCTNGVETFTRTLVVGLKAPVVGYFKLNGSETNIEVYPNAAINITWQVDNATTCSLKRGSTVISATATQGNRTVSNIASTVNVVLSCEGLGGSVSKTIEVKIKGKWYQANNQYCPTFCSGKGLSNIDDANGHRCAAGELIPIGSKSFISYSYGCWPNCSEHGAANGRSYGGMCYGSGQKRDNDRTDRTVGCHCG